MQKEIIHGKACILSCLWMNGGGFYTIQWRLKEDYRFYFRDNLLYLSKYYIKEIEDDREEYIETEKVSDSLLLDLQPTTGGFVKAPWVKNGFISFNSSSLELNEIFQQAEKIEDFFRDFIE
jgi:hypothetical protein